jgi:tellurite resistance protein
MAAIGTALVALKTKSPDDVQPYKDFVVGVAEAVANAKGGGTSEVEAQMLVEIKIALGAA